MEHLVRLKLVLLASFVLVYPATLLADTYQYTFSGSSFEGSPDFTFSTSSLITSETVVTPTSCTYNPGGGTIGCDSITVDVFNAGDFYLSPDYSWEYSEEIFTGFNLAQLGTQSNAVNSLTITDTSSTAAAPEPSSLALLGTGILSLAGIGRRRFAPRAVH